MMSQTLPHQFTASDIIKIHFMHEIQKNCIRVIRKKTKNKRDFDQENKY